MAYGKAALSSSMGMLRSVDSTTLTCIQTNAFHILRGQQRRMECLCEMTYSALYCAFVGIVSSLYACTSLSDPNTRHGVCAQPLLRRLMSSQTAEIVRSGRALKSLRHLRMSSSYDIFRIRSSASFRSSMSRSTQHLTMHLAPVYLRVNLLIHSTHHRHTITPYDVQPKRYFFTGFFVFYRSDDALDGFLEDEVHAAVARVEEPDHGAAIEGED